MVTISINDQTYEVPGGLTLLQAAEHVGITIPTLCYHKDLSPFGGCRLCVVQVRGARLPMTSCCVPVNPGIEFRTESDVIVRYRQAVLRLLLKNYYDAGYKRYEGKFDLDHDSELAHWAQFYGVDLATSMAKKPHYPVDSDPNPFVWVDMNKCIQCTRCVRACGEVQGRFVWSQSYRGYQARIVAGADSTMLASRCESCGACVVYCPTGALDNKMSVSAGPADRLVQTTCSYCGVGCQLDLNVKDDVPGGRVIRVTSHPANGSVNGLHLCLKGRYGYEFIHNPRRHTQPKVREYLLKGEPKPKGGGRWVEVDWDTALQAAAKRLRSVVDQSGGAAVGVLASGRNTNEENYLLNKLARQALHTNNIDCSANVYEASEVDGLIETLGLPVMSNSLDDIAATARALLVIGTNLTEQHPVFGAKIRQAVLRRKVKMVVASPDFVNIAEYASLALYHHPHTEAALVNGLAHIILAKGWEDKDAIEKRADGFGDYRAVIAEYAPEKVAEITGVKVELLHRAAEILSTNKPMAILFSAGIGSSEAVHALAALQLLLGNLDVPGGGVNPLRAQNNLQGAADMGCRPEWLPGYQRISSPSARAKFDQAWGARLPETVGLSAPEMLGEAAKSRVKALYIVGEGLLNTTDEAMAIRKSLEACEFVVLQEALPSETTRYADVLLPGVTFAEKDGTCTSSERRIQRVNAAIHPAGEARPDGEIIAALARKILAGEERKIEEAQFCCWDYTGPEEVMQEIACLADIYAGVRYERLERGERLQWPVRSVEDAGTKILPAGWLTSGKVRWMGKDTHTIEDLEFMKAKPEE